MFATRTRILVLLFFCCICHSTAFARSPKPVTPEAMQKKIEKLGVHREATICEKSGTCYSGRIHSIDQDSFTLEVTGLQDPVTVAYVDLTAVKKPQSRHDDYLYLIPIWVVGGVFLILVIA